MTKMTTYRTQRFGGNNCVGQ